LTNYELLVDVTSSTGLSNLTMELRVRAGGVLVASSQNAWTLTLPSSIGEIPAPPSDLTNPAEYEALLSYSPFPAGTPSTYTLSFATDAAPPPGNISLELYTQVTGLAATVWFDNVRLTARRGDPLTLTATGRCGNASHIVSAQVRTAFDGTAVIEKWSEP
jgi:hypothetical protein